MAGEQPMLQLPEVLHIQLSRVVDLQAMNDLGAPHAQELEPGIYSMNFGDSRTLVARPLGAMLRHAWRAPMLRCLAAYVRPPELNLPDAQLSGDAQEVAQQQVSALAEAICCPQSFCTQPLDDV